MRKCFEHFHSIHNTYTDIVSICFVLQKPSDKMYLIGLPENVESQWIGYHFQRILLSVITQHIMRLHIVPVAIEQHPWNIQAGFSAAFGKCLYSACADNGDDYTTTATTTTTLCTLHRMSIEKQTDFQPFISISHCLLRYWLCWKRVA